MTLKWIHENPPRWDGSKEEIVGGAPEGAFDLATLAEGELVPGEWWRAEDDGQVVGYGWMEAAWDGGEVLLAVRPGHQGRGVGTWIMDRLEEEAAERGFNYIFNEVPSTHPDAAGVTRWLENRRFQGTEDGQLRRKVQRDRGTGRG